MGALDTAVRSGRALYAGISSYSPEHTREAARIMRSLGTPLLIHQPSYSMLNRWVEEGLLDALGDEGIGCIHIQALNARAAERGQSLAQLALSWVLRDERVTSVLIGASSVAQLEANVAALGGPAFTDDELAQIDQHAVESGINLWKRSSDG